MSKAVQQINAKIAFNNSETSRLQKRKAEVLSRGQVVQIIDAILRQRAIEARHDYYAPNTEALGYGMTEDV